MPKSDREPLETVAPGAVTDFLRQLARAPSRLPRAAPPRLSAGQVLGRYQVVREIGRGGFGAVYEARDRELPRTVALKVLHVDGETDLADERLQREAEAASQLAHPNIVTFHDLAWSGDLACLVMELLHGETLDRRIARGTLPPAEALRIGREVARGLAHAHGRGVVHRDLTPANVFLCADGQVKVLDFGMAHGLGRPKLDGGTRPYMAPEQRRDAPEDERTDVFALGVILHQMLSGALPFPDAGALLGEAEAPRIEVHGWPAVGELLSRMLAKDPVARPRSGQEVVEALAALSQQLERVPPEECPVRVRPRRSPRRVALLVAAGLLGAGGVVIAMWRGRPATGAAAQPGSASEAPRPAPPPEPEHVIPPPQQEREAGETRPPPPRPRPAGRVVDCRDSINAVPTPPVESGEGVLTVEAEPFGDVYLDGKAQGETPLECRVAAGNYLVRAVHRQFGVREERVRVYPGKRRRWLADFSRGR